MEYSMLNYSSLPIKHRQLCKFLELNGWKIAHALRNGALLYKNESDKELLIPTDDSYADYGELIYSALSELSLLYKIRADILLGKIVFPDSDAFKFSLKSSSTKYGLIPLNFLVSYTESLRTWLLSGAAFVLNPKNFHAKLSYKETEDWLKRCRIGQSEFGSYVLNVIFPLEQDKQKDQFELLTTKREVPFTRKITQTLYESAIKIQLAIDNDDLEPITEQSDSVGAIISANICAAIVDMYDATRDSDIVLRPEWSNYLPISNVNIPEVLTFKRDYRQTIEDIARELTPKKAPSKEELSGFVKRLDRNLGDEEGKVAIIVGSDSRTVALTLGQQDYEKAILAHKNEAPVYFSGTIERRGNNMHVVKLDHFDMMKKPD